MIGDGVGELAIIAGVVNGHSRDPEHVERLYSGSGLPVDGHVAEVKHPVVVLF